MIKVIVCYLFLLIAALVFYIAFIDTLSLILLITTILFPVFLFVSLLIVKKCTMVSFVCEKSGECKENDVNFKVIIRNASVMPLPKVKLYISYKNLMNSEESEADFLVPLHFAATQILRFSISSQFCGNLEATLEKIVFFDYLSMFRLEKKVDLKCNTVILPTIYPLDNHIREEIAFCGEREIYSQTKPGDDVGEIFGMRDYAFGDRMSQIHWKLSSKQDSLIVKEYSKPVNSNVMLLFDFDTLNAPDGSLVADALAETLISLSNYMIDSDCRHYVGLCTGNKNYFERFDISSLEDCIVMARKLLSSCVYDHADAIEGFYKTAFECRYSHIIYASSSLDFQKAAMLEDISTRSPVSVIVVCNKPVNEILKYRTMLGSEIPFFPVECKTVEACLSELVI